MDNDVVTFVQNQFLHFMENLKLKSTDMLELKINQTFYQNSNVKHKCMTVRDKIFFEFRNILNRNYIQEYFLNIMNSKKEEVKNHPKYQKLMSLFEQVVLFIKMEEKYLNSEKKYVTLNQLKFLKEEVLRERDLLYFYIMDTYFNMYQVAKNIDCYIYGIVKRFIDDLEKDYQVDESIIHSSIDKNMSLEDLFDVISKDLVASEFYDKVHVMDEQILNN